MLIEIAYVATHVIETFTSRFINSNIQLSLSNSSHIIVNITM